MAKILLADDSTHAQRMGAKILTAEGHQVSTVSNGQAAIQALEKSVPDLVVADIFMPGRNGYEVCHFVKTDARWLLMVLSARKRRLAISALVRPWRTSERTWSSRWERLGRSTLARYLRGTTD